LKEKENFTEPNKNEKKLKKANFFNSQIGIFLGHSQKKVLLMPIKKTFYA